MKHIRLIPKKAEIYEEAYERASDKEQDRHDFFWEQNQVPDSTLWEDPQEVEEDGLEGHALGEAEAKAFLKSLRRERLRRYFCSWRFALELVTCFATTLFCLYKFFRRED